MNYTSKPKPNTMEEAIAYLQDYLENKYEEEFVFVEGDEHVDEQEATGILFYYVYFAPKDSLEKVCLARVDTGITSTASDDYGKYIFKEEAEALCGDICEEKDYIDSFTVKLTGIPTGMRWTEKNTLEQYMGEGTNMDAWNHVTIYLHDGLTDEEYAEQISDLMGEIVVLPCAVIIEAHANGEMIYWQNVYQNYKPGHDPERILSDIEGERRVKELNERYEARTQNSEQLQ